MQAHLVTDRTESHRVGYRLVLAGDAEPAGVSPGWIGGERYDVADREAFGLAERPRDEDGRQFAGAGIQPEFHPGSHPHAVAALGTARGGLRDDGEDGRRAQKAGNERQAVHHQLDYIGHITGRPRGAPRGMQARQDSVRFGRMRIRRYYLVRCSSPWQPVESPWWRHCSAADAVTFWNDAMDPENLLEISERARQRTERKVGLTMAIVAAFLATSTLLGHRLHTEEVVLQTKAADGWSYYQAKEGRYHMYAADARLAELIGPQGATVAAEWRKKAVEERGQAEAIRKDNERLDEETQTAARHATFFDASEICLEVAIVLCSIALLTSTLAFWRVSFVSTALGVVLGAAGLVLH
jgi:hypothetical protein